MGGTESKCVQNVFSAVSLLYCSMHVLHVCECLQACSQVTKKLLKKYFFFIFEILILNCF